MLVGNFFHLCRSNYLWKSEIRNSSSELCRMKFGSFWILLFSDRSDFKVTTAQHNQLVLLIHFHFRNTEERFQRRFSKPIKAKQLANRGAISLLSFKSEETFIRWVNVFDNWRRLLRKKKLLILIIKFPHKTSEPTIFITSVETKTVYLRWNDGVFQLFKFSLLFEVCKISETPQICLRQFRRTSTLHDTLNIRLY